ncbi:hypothetical protein [Hydrotalea sp.]|nr:hypothetical protein [Hydrotalea sp.]
MKKTYYLLTLACSLIFTLNLFAQKDSSGMYLTADDFKNRKLSYAINYKT